MARQNVVNAIPMDVIWAPDFRVLAASRTAEVGEDEVFKHLRSEHALVLVADIGSDLVRLSGDQAISFWNEEVRPRFVAPDEEVDLGEHSEGYCYVASLWSGPDLAQPVVLFEIYH